MSEVGARVVAVLCVRGGCAGIETCMLMSWLCVCDCGGRCDGAS